MWMTLTSCRRRGGTFNGKAANLHLGAELGNILGTGQHRWNVGPNSAALAVAKSVRALFDEVGVPFLERFTELAEVVKILRTDEKTTRLIFPFEQNPALEADRIASLMAPSEFKR